MHLKSNLFRYFHLVCSLKKEKQDEQDKMREVLSKRIQSVVTLKRDIARVRDNLGVQQARDHALLKQMNDNEQERAHEIQAAGRSAAVELLIEQRRNNMDFDREIFEEDRQQRRVEIMERILGEERWDNKRRTMHPHLYRDMRADLPDVSLDT